MKQEHVAQIQGIEQEIHTLNEQFQLIEHNLRELQSLHESLHELEKNKSKELLVNIGKRIFLPVSIRENNFIVDVGKNNLVKKNISETMSIVHEQIEKLTDGKNQVMERIEELDKEMESLVQIIEEETE